ncbi:MAG: hypothetical protein ACLQVK_22250 [Acidimicrobiales bacterium]
MAEAARSPLAMRFVVSVDAALLLRAIGVYEINRLDFAGAYLVTWAESTGVNRVASFDRSTDRAPIVERVKRRAT